MEGEDSEGGGEGKDKGKGEDQYYTQLCWFEVVCVYLQGHSLRFCQGSCRRVYCIPTAFVAAVCVCEREREAGRGCM